MTLRRLILVPALLLFVASLCAAEIDVEFSAVLVASGQTTVHLTRKSTGASAWIPLGQTFGGYVVSSYEAKSDSIILTKDGIPIRLRLKSAKVKAADPVDQEKVTKAVLNNIRQLAAAADQFYLENGKNTATLADLVGPTKYIKELKSVDGEDYNQVELKQGKELVVTTASGATVKYLP
jgi:type IV pilus assembly protein PilA